MKAVDSEFLKAMDTAFERCCNQYESPRVMVIDTGENIEIVEMCDVLPMMELYLNKREGTQKVVVHWWNKSDGFVDHFR